MSSNGEIPQLGSTKKSSKSKSQKHRESPDVVRSSKSHKHRDSPDVSQSSKSHKHRDSPDVSQSSKPHKYRDSPDVTQSPHSHKYRDSPDVSQGTESSKSRKHSKSRQYSESPDVTESERSHKHKSRKHSDRHHGSSPDVASESDHSRPSSAQIHRPKSRGSRTPSDDESYRSDRQSPGTPDSPSGSKSAASKKTMLKYMIHEVRELKRQLDPNSPDIHIWKKRDKKPGSGGDTSDPDEGQGSDIDLHGRRRLPAIPQGDSDMETEISQLSRTYPPPGVESGSFLLSSHRDLSRTAPIDISYFRSASQFSPQQLLDALEK